ncbi:MAG TPA: hypothetical protein VN193_03445 [Candidatus Angelobacter sp.]|nr:hypothetical protein [Candidatus Angelobacter sp.]
MSARPLRADAGLGAARAPRRNLRPLLAAVALAAVVAGIAGGAGLHSRLSGRSGSPAGSPPPVPSAVPATPAPTPAYQAAPFISLFNSVQAGWDSTHRQLVAYIAASPKTSNPTQIWTWDGSWHQHDASGGPGINDQGLWLDDPSLHGMVLIGGSANVSGSNWLWDGSSWTRLPDTPSQYCMGPAQAAFDLHRDQLVVLLSDQCSGGNTILPTETWTLDGRTWHQHATTPGNGPSAMAWDPQANAVVMLGPDSTGKARAWTWTGNAWTRGPASTVDYPTESRDRDGAAWDAHTGAVVLWAPAAYDGSKPATVIADSRGSFRALPQSGYPEGTVAVFADGTHGRLLAIGQEAIPAAATPAGYDANKDYYVLAWTGSTWVPLTAP